MTKAPDDLEAVRAVVSALEGFEAKEQLRIIRWAAEKLALPLPATQPTPQPPIPVPGPRHDPSPTPPSPSAQDGRDAKSFVASKNPLSNNQLAATVAYYYRFEAPDDQRKAAIKGEDLQEACRLAGRARLQDPNKTLHNAHAAGLLDKGTESGAYAINSVGENLVAMTLPSAGQRPTNRTTSGRVRGVKRRLARKSK